MIIQADTVFFLYFPPNSSTNIFYSVLPRLDCILCSVECNNLIDILKAVCISFYVSVNPKQRFTLYFILEKKSVDDND